MEIIELSLYHQTMAGPKMGAWREAILWQIGFFVDLGLFVDKITLLLERLSIYHLSLNHLKFAERKQVNSPQIIFFDGNRGEAYLKKQIQYTHRQDLIYLIVDFSSLSAEAEKKLNALLLNANRVKGIIDRSKGVGIILAQLNGIKEISDLLFEVETDNEYIDDFKQRLDRVSRHTSVQLERIKRLHRSLIPQRELQFGVLKTVCKYAAGDSQHSEFWDLTRTKKKQQVTLLLSTASSKELTTVLDRIISFLDQEDYLKKDIKIFYHYLKETLQDSFSLFIMLTQVENVNSFLIVDGPFLAFINGVPIDSIKQGELSRIQLRNHDKFFIISDGMVKNYKREFRDDELLQLLKKKWQLPSHEFIQQVFLGAKINKKGPFHYYDGTTIILEVMQ